MAIIKWEPFGDMDRFFYDLHPASFPTFSSAAHDLAVDLFEEKGNLVARMHIPGMNAEDIKVSVDDERYLSIRAERSEEKEEKEKHYYSKEIRHGSFERMLRLPKDVDKEKITASYEKGVLTVTLPEVSKKLPERTEIKVAAKD